MKFPLKTITTSAVMIALLAISWLSCNKDNTPQSTTVIKCVSCANGGLCLNDTCRCPAGFEGLTCQTLSFQKFMGTWTVTEKGSATGAASSYNIEIEENINSVTTVSITELDNPYYPSSFNAIIANINADSIFIPSQVIGSAYIVGKGFFKASTTTGLSSKITMKYQLRDTITGITNDFGYNNSADSPSVWSQE
jgi:hypothetical protein